MFICRDDMIDEHLRIPREDIKIFVYFKTRIKIISFFIYDDIDITPKYLCLLETKITLARMQNRRFAI